MNGIREYNSQIPVRKSGVELIRLIAMMLICISHCTQSMEKFVDFQTPSWDLSLLTMRFMRFGGTMGNILFVVCSSYFLVKRKKIRSEKAINILLDSQMISIGLFCCFCGTALLRGSAFHFTTTDIFAHLFPDLYETVWFVPCYVIFYLIHPALNLVIENLTQKQHLSVCILIFAVYGVGGLVNIAPVFSSLLGFICIFFLVSYMKLYCFDFVEDTKKNVRYFSLFFFLFIGIVLAKNILAQHFEFFVIYPEIGGLLSVVFLPMLICLFNIFLKIEHCNRFVNYVASTCLFFYCIHENKIVREEIRPQIYGFLINRFGSDYLLLYVFFLTAVLLFVGFGVSIIYRETFHKLNEKLATIISQVIKNGYDKWFLKKEHTI